MMSADSMTVMDGPFYFNNKSFDMDRIDYRIPLNNIEVWTLFDSTMVAHPFHIHDVHFYILDRDGVPASAAEAGPKDVVLVKPMETVRFITKFDDFADTTIPYMYHCHILMHEDDGMMGQFVVTPFPEAVNNIAQEKNSVLVYPNPAGNYTTISLNGSIAEKGVNISVCDVLGRNIFSGTMDGNNFVLNTTGWYKGIYSIMLTGKHMRHIEKLVIR